MDASQGTKQPDEWVSAAALAQRLNVQPRHLRKLVARRQIPHGRVGRLIRFHLPTVERWLLAVGNTAAGGDAAGNSIASTPSGRTP